MNNAQEILNGKALSPGIAIGVGYILETKSPEIIQSKIKKNEIKPEIERIKQAANLAYKQIAKLQTKAETLPAHAAEEIILLLDVHLSMVDDKSRLIKDVLKRVETEKINAEWAVKKEITAYKKIFSQMEDQYLSRRIKDVRDVGRRLIKNLMGHKFVALKAVPKGGIVLAEEITSADTAFMNPDKISGFISLIGGQQSHAAIMARSLGLPAIGGLPNIPQSIHADSIVIIDGNEGTVIVNPDEKTVQQYRRRLNAYQKKNAKLSKKADLPTQTKDGVLIDIQANLSSAEDIDIITDSTASGIGLLRSEFMFMNRDDIPSEQEQYDYLSNIIRAMNGRVVTIRTMDIGADKLSPAFQHKTGHEVNPALGLRGIRLSLETPKLLKDQLRAALRVSKHGPIRILIPMVSNIEEMIECRRIYRNVIRELRRKNITIASKPPPLGIMIETPAAALIADDLAKKCNFFSIGTNDLTQYTLATDRTNEAVANLYKSDHPAVLNLMNMAIKAAEKNNIPISICGEMAGDSEQIETLLKLGIRSLSINAPSIPIIKEIIRKIRLT